MKIVRKDILKKPYLTPNELAELLMVSPVTVRHWANKGMIDAILTPGGHRRFAWDAIEKFAQSRGVDLYERHSDEFRVLIVDDDITVCEAIEDLLHSQPTQIVTRTAHSGFDAGLLIHSFKPTVMLLDLMMPQIDGFEVCRRMAQDNGTRNVRIIAMTGYYSPDNVKKSREAGAECCLKKPLNPDELITALGHDQSVIGSVSVNG